eukprot:99403_1
MSFVTYLSLIIAIFIQQPCNSYFYMSIRPGSCNPVEHGCNSPSDCCSGQCNEDNFCVDPYNCQQQGMSCGATEGVCCATFSAGTCEAGICNPSPCTANDRQCLTDSECCSGNCKWYGIWNFGPLGTCQPKIFRNLN